MPITSIRAGCMPVDLCRLRGCNHLSTSVRAGCMPPVYRPFSNGRSILAHFNFCKDVSHLVLLRLQIEAVVLLRIDLDRHALMDLKSEAGKSVDLLRIVREKSQGLHAEIP